MKRCCIDQYINYYISSFNVSIIDKLLEKVVDVPKTTVITLRGKLIMLRNYIMGLQGCLQENEQKAEQVWAELQKKQKQASDAIAKEYDKPRGWLTIIRYWAPLGIPEGIRILNKWNDQKQAVQEVNESAIKKCIEEVQLMHGTLQELKEIEAIIQKQEEIDKAFNSVPISLESFNMLNTSMQERINKVRAVYGADDWDKRVAFLADRFRLNNLDPENMSHVSCISAYAYWLIEPDLSYVGYLAKRANAYIEWFGEKEKDLAEKWAVVMAEKDPSKLADTWKSALERAMVNVVTDFRMENEELNGVGMKAIRAFEVFIYDGLKFKLSGDQLEYFLICEAANTLKEALILADKWPRTLQSTEPMILENSWADAWEEQSPVAWELLKIWKERAKTKLLKVVVIKEWGDIFGLSIHKKLPHATDPSQVGMELIEILGNRLPQLGEDSSGFPSKSLPLFRALSAAALLKKHEKNLQHSPSLMLINKEGRYHGTNISKNTAASSDRSDLLQSIKNSTTLFSNNRRGCKDNRSDP